MEDRPRKILLIKIMFITNIISLVLLIVVLMHYNIPGKIALKVSGAYHRNYTNYEIRNGLFSVYDQNMYKIIMLGDSIIEGAAWNELLGIQCIANRGVSGDTTEGILARLPDIYKLNPEICFLMTGINDIENSVPAETIINNMEIIIEELRSNGIQVITQSTIYAAKNIKNWKKMNAEIDKINFWLEEYSRGRNLLYIDINKLLKSGNALNAEYTYDGIHLLAAGYQKWKDLLLPVIEKCRKQDR